MYFDYSLKQLTEVYNQAAQNEMPARWRSALDRAFGILKGIDSVKVAFAPDGSISEATIPSQSGKGSYTVNGQCSCEAAAHGKPCAHAAAKRLVVRMYEAQQALSCKSVTLREQPASAAPEAPQMTASDYEAQKAAIEQKIVYQQRKLAELEAAYAQQQGRVVEVPRKSREQVMTEMDELFPPRQEELTRENAFPGFATRKRPDLFKDED
jgi:hypothetical protein